MKKKKKRFSQNSLKLLDEIYEETLKCMKCGLCRSVCPVFLETQLEPNVARGKIALVQALKEGDLEVTKILEDRLSRCLLCGTCAMNCPSGVRVDLIVAKARVLAQSVRGLSPIKWFLLRIFLKNRWVFKLGVKIGAILQPVLFSRRKEGFEIGLSQKRVVMPLKKDRFLDLCQDTIEANKKKVAIFFGCTINFILHHLGKSMIEILKSKNVSIIIPKSQVCCGLVAESQGDEETFRKLAEENIDAFYGLSVDYIVFACATCYYTFKKAYLEMLFDEKDPYFEKANWVAKRCIDITEYLVNVASVEDVYLDENIFHKVPKVTYHDPCHMAKGLGIKDAPRRFIERIKGIEFLEMEEPDRCCGGGGSFSLKYYDISLSILKKKMENVKKTKADILLTTCSGCYNQLFDGAKKFSDNLLVMHPVELYYIAWSGKYESFRD